MVTARPPFEPPGPDAAVFVISVAAELSGLHPQTLRTYERLGLITPGRTGGGGRRYSARDIELLREIADLTAAGTGIEGVRRILELEDRVAALSQRNEELQAELASTREALRQAVGRRTPPLGSAAAPAASAGAPAPNKLPVLRRSGTGQAVVVWRRQRG
jgi:MerR family transcriptional regulator/heat shock protein HspR